MLGGENLLVLLVPWALPCQKMCCSQCCLIVDARGRIEGLIPGHQRVLHKKRSMLLVAHLGKPRCALLDDTVARTSALTASTCLFTKLYMSVLLSYVMCAVAM